MRIGWSQIIGVNPKARIGIMPPFGADGGKGSVHLGNGSFGITFLKKNTPDRIKMLLRICDWLAAPFGSEERIPVRWGVQDVDFTFDEQGNPRPTKQGLAEVIISWQYQGPVGQVAYDPVMSEDFARTVNGWEQAAMAVGVADPTIGLYSPTDAAQGSVLRQAIYDGVTQIVLGRGALWISINCSRTGRPRGRQDAWRIRTGVRDHQDCLSTRRPGSLNTVRDDTPRPHVRGVERDDRSRRGPTSRCQGHSKGTQ